jgi:hypothetical protein
MKSPRGKSTVAKIKRWRVVIMKSRARYLGVVEAPDARASGHAATLEADKGELAT